MRVSIYATAVTAATAGGDDNDNNDDDQHQLQTNHNYKASKFFPLSEKAVPGNGFLSAPEWIIFAEDKSIDMIDDGTILQ